MGYLMDKGRFGMIKDRHFATYKAALGQGKMDIQMVPLCEFVAKTKGYYTSSCCSGRIILLEKRGKRKIDTFFHRKWHREITEGELIEGFDESTKGEVWLRIDPFILHIGCKNLEDCSKILAAMKAAGVKRGGIIVADEEKFMVELQGTDSMSLLIKKGEKKLVSEEYLQEIVPLANNMLRQNYARLTKLENAFRNLLE